MRYIQITENNVVEVREDALKVLPPNAIQLSDDDYDKLLSRKFLWVNGVIVAAPQKELS